MSGTSLLFAEIAATCNSLGYSDGNKYFIDPQCEEAIKDLNRFLRRDDENHEIRRHLGDAKILQTDLIPILKQFWEKTEIFDLTLRLLVNLTYPALVLYQAELPADKTSRYYYLQIITHLQSYKEAFIDEQVWAILCQKLGELLQIEWQDRSEDQSKVIERILILVRNVLQVPADSDSESRPDNDANIHDQVLWSLYQSGMVGLFHYIASSQHEDKFFMHILEIISLMLRDQNPAFLAESAVQRSATEKVKDEKELVAIREKETEEKHRKVKKYTGARFTGSYVVTDLKSISDQSLIYHKPLSSLTSLDFNHDKKKVKRPKNRLPMQDGKIERRSTLSVRLFLKEFCVEFLNGAYNTLMYNVKDLIQHGRNQVNDESYYLWAMKFFMEFNRHYKAEMKLVSETMSLSSFHFVQTQIENFYERMVADKKKIFMWSRRMHLALRAYQELLMTLIVMDNSNDSSIQESAHIIKSNIFYVVEYRELILTLMLNFDELKFSKIYLKDLIETVHTFLKLLEKFCSKSRGIIVQQKHKSKSLKKQKKQKTKSNPTPVVELNTEEMWESMEPEVSSLLQSQPSLPDVVPFDSASDTPIDDQKVDAIRKIQTALHEKNFEAALGLLRASREVWPENDSFGIPNPSPEEELLFLKEIFTADLGQAFPTQSNANNADKGNEDEKEEEEEEEEEDDRDVDVGEATTSVAERNFQFVDFVKRFVQPRVIQAAALLLRQFEKNNTRTNMCIVKLLHRIAWDCKMPSMLFQASVFRTFQNILESTSSEHKELKKFAAFIIRKFVEVAKVNPKVYMELLFWKSSRDAYEIENGYGSYNTESHSSKQVWGEEEEDELRRLHDEYMGTPEGKGEDMVDWILKTLINENRSRRGVIKKLKELGYTVATKASRKSSVSMRPPVQWTSEEEEQLAALFQEFKDAYDPLGCILDRLKVRRPKHRVSDKLLEMGLIQDKKELRKKRAKKSGNSLHNASKSGSSSGSDDDCDSGSGSGSGAESDASGAGPSTATPRQQTKVGPQRKAKKSKNRAKKPVHFSQIEACKLMQQVRTAGMSEALAWVAESFGEAAEDQESAPDASQEAVPLVPITEESASAMDTPLFQQLLRTLGISEPSDEQEAYWRIPGSLSSAEMRSRADLILNPPSESIFSTQDLDQEVADVCRKIISENTDNLGIENDSSDAEELGTSVLSLEMPSNTSKIGPKDNDITNKDAESSSAVFSQLSPTSSTKSGNETNSKIKRRIKSIIPTDSSESEDETSLELQPTALAIEQNIGRTSSANSKYNSTSKPTKRVQSRVLTDSSSESDGEIVDCGTEHNSVAAYREEVKKQIEASAKRVLDSDSDDDVPKTKKQCKIVVSDDDD